MASYQKFKVLGVKRDETQLYENGEPVKGQKAARIRVLVVPVKPDKMTINITALGDEVINKFLAIEGMEGITVLMPGRTGATDGGSLFITPEQGLTADEIEIIRDPLPKPPAQAAATGGATAQPAATGGATGQAPATGGATGQAAATRAATGQ